MKKIFLLLPTLQAAYVNLELLGKIEQLNLNIIKDRMIFKHKWPVDRAEEAIVGYRQYLYLANVLETPIAPSLDINQIWHEHILHTNKYANDCQVIFNKFLHHFPTPVKWKLETIAGAFCCNKQDCCNDDPRVGGAVMQIGSNAIVESAKIIAHTECGEPAPGGCAPIGGSDNYCGGTTNDGFVNK